MCVWKKRAVCVLLALALALGLLAGCQSNLNDGDKDTLIFGTHADPGTLAPAGTNARQATRIKWNIYETLCNLGYDGQMQPVLAESWELVDSTHWKFYLREGVVFHNGDVMTPQDVLFSFELAAAGTFAGASGKNMDLENAVIDEKENSLTIALFEPDSTFLYSAASYCITSRRAYEADPDGMVNRPIGSGPYVCEEYVVGDSVTLARFENYWGEPAVIEHVIYRVIPESSQRAIELETGGVDFIFEMDQTDASRLKDDPHFQIETKSSITNECLFYNNWEGSPFSDKRVRQAVSYAINAEAVLKVVYQNGAVSSTFFTDVYDLWKDEYRENELYPYDLDKAKALMEEAGYADGFDAVLLVESVSSRMLMAEVIQNMLEKINIHVSVSVLEGAGFYGTFRYPDSGWDMFINGSSTQSTALALTRNLMGNSSNNYESFFNQEMWDLIDTGLAAGTVEEQQAVMDRIVELFREEIPYYPIHDNVEIAAYRSSLQNFQFFNAVSAYPADLYFENG